MSWEDRELIKAAFEIFCNMTSVSRVAVRLLSRNAINEAVSEGVNRRLVIHEDDALFTASSEFCITSLR